MRNEGGATLRPSQKGPPQKTDPTARLFCRIRKAASSRRTPKLFPAFFCLPGLAAAEAEQAFIYGNASGTDCSERQAGGTECERKLIQMHGQDAAAAVNLPNGDGHFDGEQECCRPSEQSKNKKKAAEGFEHASDINKLSGEAVLDEHVLHFHARANQLGIAVGDEDDAKRDAQSQKTDLLQPSEKIHFVTGLEVELGSFGILPERSGARPRRGRFGYNRVFEILSPVEKNEPL